MKNKHLSKTIFAVFLLLIFAATPLMVTAKPNNQGKGKPGFSIKNNQKAKAKETKEEKKERKAVQKGEKRQKNLTIKLDAIDSVLINVSEQIDAYIGRSDPEGTGEDPNTKEETTSDETEPTEKENSEDSAEEEEPAEEAHEGNAELGDTEEKPVEDTDGEEAGEVDEAENEDEAEVNEGECPFIDKGRPSATGFVNGTKGKLNALFNRLHAVKKQMDKLIEEDAILERVQDIAEQINYQLERLNAVVLEPVSENEGADESEDLEPGEEEAGAGDQEGSDTVDTGEK